jgi:hypothetical protein
MRLLDYAANVHSQYGEDGIISKLLGALPERDKWCVEFGAWDGEYLSNSRNLICKEGYSAIMIEADGNRIRDLAAKYKSNPKVIPMQRFVGFDEHDGLDALLKSHPIPSNFDFLSVDIDGNDYHVWAAVQQYTPKVVCIEFNPSIATEVDFVQRRDRRISQGSSLLALVKLAVQKGYQLVCVTLVNALFVRAEYFPLFGISNNDPRLLREDVSAVTHIFSGYDGTLHVAGADRMPWHRLTYEGRIRQLPSFFRTYPQNYGAVQNFLFKVYRKTCRMLNRG